MLSTIAMVRLGKTYGNLMVDLRPTNAKLRARATGIVGDIAGVSRDEAADALERTGFDVKQAVLVARLGIPPRRRPPGSPGRRTAARLRSSALEADEREGPRG